MAVNRRAGIFGVVAAVIVSTAAWLYYAPSLATTLAGDSDSALSVTIFTFVMFAPLLVSGFAGAAAYGPSTRCAGQGSMGAGLRGGAVGLVGILLATAYAALAGTIQRGVGGGASAVLLIGLAVIAFQVAAEELLFRGWLQPLLAQVTGHAVAIGGIAVAFSALHLLAGGRDVVVLVNLTLGGVLFGLLAARDGGIIGAFAAHFVWNAVEQLALGLDPNPGIGSFGSIIDLDLVGAMRWGGSDYGLNASWAMGIALAAVVVPLAILDRRKLAAPTAANNAISPSPRRPT